MFYKVIRPRAPRGPTLRQLLTGNFTAVKKHPSLTPAQSLRLHVKPRVAGSTGGGLQPQRFLQKQPRPLLAWCHPEGHCFSSASCTQFLQSPDSLHAFVCVCVDGTLISYTLTLMNSSVKVICRIIRSVFRWLTHLVFSGPFSHTIF